MRTLSGASGLRRAGWGPLCTCTLLGACADLPPAPPAPPAAFLPGGAGWPPPVIGVEVAGWHTGIVIPASELGPLRALLGSDPRARDVAFGWGNRRFYMSRHPDSGDALAALLHSPSAVLVQPVASPADLAAGDAAIHWVCADRLAVWRIDRYIARSLAAPRPPDDLGSGPFPNSRFYASTGRYSAVHTCNTWTVAALQYAGLPVSASNVLFAGQVARRVRGLRVCPATQ